MTDKLRRQIAMTFRKLLNEGALDKNVKAVRKEALLYIRQTYGTPERTLYDWCSRFGVSTK